MSILARPDITREAPKAFRLFQIRLGRSEILSKQGISICRRFCQCNVRIGWPAILAPAKCFFKLSVLSFAACMISS